MNIFFLYTKLGKGERLNTHILLAMDHTEAGLQIRCYSLKGWLQEISEAILTVVILDY